MIPSIFYKDLPKVFFYLLVVLLPIQTRVIFFTEHSVFFGYHVFYNTFYLYLTDAVSLGLILSWFFKDLLFSREKIKIFSVISKKLREDVIFRSFLIFWLILATSVVFSRENSLGFYGLAKISQFLIVFAYIREKIRISHEKKLIFSLILASIFFQSLIGIMQYLTQSSVGLKVLGEEFLRPGLKGIAEFPAQGVVRPIFYDFFPYLSRISQEILNIRAYGTLPHPNVLAGFLISGLLINFYLLYFSREKWAKVTLSLTFITLSTGLVVTFSRFAWAAAFLAIVFWLGLVLLNIRRRAMLSVREGNFGREKNFYFPGKVVFSVLLILVSLGLNVFLFGQQVEDRIFTSNEIGPGTITVSDQSLVDRQIFNSIALKMIEQDWIIGVGWKNFVVRMDDFSREKLLPFMHQPVHNIYLLITAEAGVFALLFFLFGVFYIVRRCKNTITEPLLRYTLLIILGAFLGLGLIDHYFLTIQQGSLIFWLTLGMLATKNA